MNSGFYSLQVVLLRSVPLTASMIQWMQMRKLAADLADEENQ